MEGRVSEKKANTPNDRKKEDPPFQTRGKRVTRDQKVSEDHKFVSSQTCILQSGKGDFIGRKVMDETLGISCACFTWGSWELFGQADGG